MTSDTLLPASDPLYLLLIGETGSGKTTLINSFANYSRYATLDETIEKGPVVLADTCSAAVSSVYTIGFDKTLSEDLICYDSPGFGSHSFGQLDKDKK